jgi:hypothetical protein
MYCGNVNEEVYPTYVYENGKIVLKDIPQIPALLKLFDEIVSKLKGHGINVIVVEDDPNQQTPDAVFPNNWVSFHNDGRIGLYPMYSPIRRKERRSDIYHEILQNLGFKITDIVDFYDNESNNQYLESTGSMVLDRVNKIAYASLSDRTHPDVLNDFTKAFNYKEVIFRSYQSISGNRRLIYHTNVMMCVGDDFAILCKDAIDDQSERQQVIGSLTKTGKEIIYITEEQTQNFAGNMLEVKADSGKKYLVMSETAHNSLNEQQLEVISNYCTIIHSPLNIIETCGGGSARCMMAEIFLPHQ